MLGIILFQTSSWLNLVLYQIVLSSHKNSLHIPLAVHTRSAEHLWRQWISRLSHLSPLCLVPNAMDMVGLRRSYLSCHYWHLFPTQNYLHCSTMPLAPSGRLIRHISRAVSVACERWMPCPEWMTHSRCDRIEATTLDAKCHLEEDQKWRVEVGSAAFKMIVNLWTLTLVDYLMTLVVRF